MFRNQPYVQCYKKSVGRKAYLNKPETFNELIAQCLTNLMEQNPYLEADSRLAGQDIP
jgi:hypothetical protein